MTSTVLMNGERVPFGQCLRCLLLRAGGQDSADPLHVNWSLNSHTLELDLRATSATAGGGVLFEHFPTCPAEVHNTTNPSSTIKIGVATVLEKDECVLITQRHSQLRSFPNIWVLPGGHLDAGETLFQAAEREVWEETGLRCASACGGQLLGMWESTFPHLASLGKMTHHHAVCYVHSRLDGSSVMRVQANEVQAVAWLTQDHVRGILSQQKADGGMGAPPLVQVYRIQSTTTTPSDNNDDAWHEDKADVRADAESVSCAEMYDSMSAGTHFALRQWLVTKQHKHKQQQQQPRL